ncbi:glycine cleavage system aminomethyltransferase GcvT [Pseudokineococcus basanitobsidens]|uniref:glycine cleavage system aminomethyltransferase GcvT n=1 Tax=Pseudokineococcus basanitobsidens TaxID=1926649 RepID=UPI003F4E0FA0
MREEAADEVVAPPSAQHGPLHERHVAAGARMADFGGWSMPLEHAGGGVVAEHRAVREAAGLFDVSHLGKVRVRGEGAAAFVDGCLANDLGRIAPGRAQYTLCCAEDGGVVDDLIAYLVGDDEVFTVPNAANAAEVARRLREAAPAGVEVLDEHREHAVLAVQGPESDGVLHALGLPVGADYMGWVEASWRGRPVLVCRTGYTGERGYELVPRWEDAGDLWDAALEQVRARDGRACGLGARDTLRTEMGYALHGHELTREITPVQARTGWAVGWDKPAFWGRAALVAEREAGPARRAWGLLAEGRGVLRSGLPVEGADGTPLGTTTSGTFSPTLGVGIALALLDPGVARDDVVAVDVRGRSVRCRVVRPPFVPDRTRA